MSKISHIHSIYCLFNFFVILVKYPFSMSISMLGSCGIPLSCTNMSICVNPDNLGKLFEKSKQILFHTFTDCDTVSRAVNQLGLLKRQILFHPFPRRIQIGLPRKLYTAEHLTQTGELYCNLLPVHGKKGVTVPNRALVSNIECHT